ncbi:histidinol phosphate phosphatase domain-containing protein [Rossellomorea aquimaris]|uniref:histidinol phosphate phosphatase domain-containing protein n=1 Tax=Rossellomorea aquimaris TaxID=189382 RepID=UPI001CD4936D|nr:histidinol phosphate phosphatase domain-containing protein [Rossellomorea aquimaris]MCA1054387.1 histidinol phosphate phosphatase domain-containing protein [Rossellomorea aquimaris]
MTVDYHVHLEEGPYSFRWLERTSRALRHFHGNDEGVHHRSWIQTSHSLLSDRLEKGPYSAEWLDLYLKKAKERNLKEVGIVDHLYRFVETRDYFEHHMDLSDTELGRKQHRWLNQVMTERMADFVRFIESQKEKWANEGIVLKLGMEADFFPGCHDQLKALLDAYNWDYVIGSVHFIDGWGFDNPDAIDQFERYDLDALYARFFGIVEEAIRSNLFDFVAHLDNLKVFNFRPDERTLLPHYEKIAKALVETNTATEVNAGLFYRYPIKEMCPSDTFLTILANAGVKFTTSSDSHFPDDIGMYIGENTEKLRKLGIDQITTF